ncbi:MAG: HAD family phosphatase, partial [Eubacteriales bacterium]|nr:HAD family phosphatase [Eubacteriales bacterium]
MNKRAVIFDMDGLMFDTQSIYDSAYIEVGRNEYGIEIPDALSRRLRGSGGVNLEESVHAFFPEIDAHAFIRRSFDLTAEKAAQELRIKPGLEDLLDYLQKESYTLALASGSERALVEANLKKAGMRHLFMASLCGDEVTHGKPDPELYLRVAQMIGFAPRDCYVIEDSVNGIIAGH